MSTITLVPIGSALSDTLVRLSRRVGEVFRSPSCLGPLLFDPSQAFDSYRNQYNSTTLLSLLLSNSDETEGKILGVTEYDLFVPVLTFVFGEAQLNGRAAVVSSFRLRPELYGLPENKDLLNTRLDKESIHELGHTFGLIHCNNAFCVMHSSTYAEDIDLKTNSLCPECIMQLFSADSSIVKTSS